MKSKRGISMQRRSSQSFADQVIDIINLMKHSDLNQIAEILGDLGVDIDKNRTNGQSLILQAALRNETFVVKTLQKLGANIDVYAGDKSVLQAVIERKQFAMARLLIQLGARPEVRIPHGLIYAAPNTDSDSYKAYLDLLKELVLLLKFIVQKPYADRVNISGNLEVMKTLKAWMCSKNGGCGNYLKRKERNALRNILTPKMMSTAATVMTDLAIPDLSSVDDFLNSWDPALSAPPAPPVSLLFAPSSGDTDRMRHEKRKREESDLEMAIRLSTAGLF